MTYRLLIVDDSKLARMSVIKALNALHPEWERVEATGSDEALAAMAQAPADIALLDFNMPGRDGLALAADLRARHPIMPIAVISANHQTEIVERARGVGATFLTKPLTEQDLDGFFREAVRKLGGGVS